MIENTEIIDRLKNILSFINADHMAAAKLLSTISALKSMDDISIKGQDNSNVIYKNNPQEISIYKNGASGNLFFAKHCETAQNRVIPKKVELDDRGVILVFN